MIIGQDIQQFSLNLWSLWVDAAPWLLFGLLLAGVVKAWLPATLMNRWLGGRGIGPIIKAAILGTPLPLCSCSVLPAAMTLRRSGGSKGATVSFLIATPENGIDSIALSYVLLGPFMTVVRPIAAIFSAVLAGVLTEYVVVEGDGPAPIAAKSDCHGGCCCQSGKTTQATPKSPWQKCVGGMTYALVDLLRDIAGWLLVGFLMAAAVQTLVPHESLVGWGSGLPAMLAVMLVGVPMYSCATSSTPIAAAMLVAGVSPGTVLVFLLAGPATNIGTMGIVRRELGWGTLLTYLTGICGGALAMGLLTDFVVAQTHLRVVAQAGHAAEILPSWLSVSAAVFLIAAAILPRIYRRKTPAPCPTGATEAQT